VSQATRAYLFYLPLNSPFFSINPVSKVAILVSLGILALLYVNVFFQLILMAATVLLLLAAKTSLRRIWKFILVVAFTTVFFALSFIFLSQIPGRVTYITWPWGFYVTDATIVTWLAQSLRFQVMALASMLFFSTTRDSDIVDALRFLRLPYNAAFMTALTLRSCTMFLDDWRTINEAMTSKGVDLKKGSVIQRVKKQLFIIWPMMFVMFSRVKDIAFSIESRGYGSFKNPTKFRVIAWNKADIFVLAVSAGSIISLVIYLYVLGLRLPTTI
jgi:energy-coupling factor transport system permease protein